MSTAEQVPRDVLTKLFLMMTEANMTREVWSVVPLVSRRWYAARQNSRVKSALAGGSASRFDQLCKRQALRRPMINLIARICAHARVNGYSVPDLWKMDNLLSINGWRSSGELIEYLEEKLEQLQSCLDLIKNPPSWAFAQTTIVPLKSRTYDWTRDQHFFRLDDYFSQLVGLIEILIGKTHLSPTQSLFCNGHPNCYACDIPLGRTAEIKSYEPLCKRCGRQYYLVREQYGGKVIAAVKMQNSQVVMRSLPSHFLHVGESMSPDDVWYPEIELQCQQYVADLIDPIDGMMRLSSTGLSALLDQDDEEEAMQQIQLAHTLSLEKEPYDRQPLAVSDIESSMEQEEEQEEDIDDELSTEESTKDEEAGCSSSD